MLIKTMMIVNMGGTFYSFAIYIRIKLTALETYTSMHSGIGSMGGIQ
jgi:hypothetical protein